MTVITTWNLENFFRPGGEYGPRTQDVYEKKLAYLADRINASAPDVVAVQEVGAGNRHYRLRTESRPAYALPSRIPFRHMVGRQDQQHQGPKEFVR
jgi:hypothetical protein